MRSNTPKLFFLSCLAMVFLMTGCDREEEAIPTYLEILPFELSTDYTTQGSASEKIVDVWLYVGIEFLGVYELPATVPFLATGPTEITLFPGIKVNGFAARPEINNFYNQHIETMDFVPGEVTTVQPKTTYKENVVFPFIENFEGQHIVDEDEDGNSNTFFTPTTTGAFENESGLAFLDVENIEVEASTSIRFEDLPVNNSTVYLELDYKSDVQFAIGLIGHQANGSQAQQYFIALNAKGDWNKIYIDLTDELTASGLEKYQVVFNSILPIGADGEFPLDEANLYLDNIKLVHFEQ